MKRKKAREADQYADEILAEVAGKRKQHLEPLGKPLYSVEPKADDFYRKAREAGISEDEIAEAKRQEKEVYDRYHDKDGKPLAGWGMAPNGKKSKLNDKQWAQVRTPNFKKWFGDWEAAALIDMAEKAWNGDMTPARINFAPSDKLKVELKKLAVQDLQQVFITDSDVRHIKKRHGQNQVKQGQIDLTPEDIALIPFVMNEFDTAKHDETDSSGNKKFLFEKQINGTAYVASIERGKNKEQIITLWKTKNPVHHAANGNPPLTSKTTQAGSIIQQADDLRNSRNNVSKAIDENGEPLVVYHGSWSKFDTFHTGINDGIFFTPSEDFAKKWSGESRPGTVIYRAFLNARKLFDVKNPEHFMIIEDVINAGNGDATHKATRITDAKRGTWIGLEQPDIIKAIRSNGFDGYFVTEGIFDKNRNIAVFSPNQIKSATDNGGDVQREGGQHTFSDEREASR
jgi:hypothetical protein